MSQLICLLAALMLIPLTFQTNYEQTKRSSNADETAIRNIVKRMESGWNAHDGKTYTAPFANDADFVVINGMKIKGKDSIEQGHTGIFKTIYKDTHNTGTVKSIRFLRPDVALVHVEWQLELPAAGQTEIKHAMNTLVLTKENGQWSIAAFQNTMIQTPAQ